MYYILYLSAATSWVTQAELEEVLAASRRNNLRNHITGLLLYGSNNFIQLLEGERKDVEDTFRKIGADLRHSDVTVIASGGLKCRCFPGWEMGFKSLPAETKKDLADFIENARISFANNDCQLPVTMLQSFLRKAKIDRK